MPEKKNYRWETWGEVFRHYKRKGYYLANARYHADEYMARRRKSSEREQQSDQGEARVTTHQSECRSTTDTDEAKL